MRMMMMMMMMIKMMMSREEKKDHFTQIWWYQLSHNKYPHNFSMIESTTWKVDRITFLLDPRYDSPEEASLQRRWKFYHLVDWDQHWGAPETTFLLILGLDHLPTNMGLGECKNSRWACMWSWGISTKHIELGMMKNIPPWKGKVIAAIAVIKSNPRWRSRLWGGVQWNLGDEKFTVKLNDDSHDNAMTMQCKWRHHDIISKLWLQC